MDRSSACRESTGNYFQLFLNRRDQVSLVAILIALQVWVVSWVWPQAWLSRQQAGPTEPRWAEFQVDLNTASWPELATIPGLGEHLARSITDYRQLHGDFASIESLREVDGIGPWRMEQLSPHLAPINPGTSLVQAGGRANNP